MNRHSSTIRFSRFILSVFILCLYSQNVPNLIDYQGMVSSTDGTQLNGPHSIEFFIYDADEDGEALWSEIQNPVYISNGLFHVYLGAVNPLPGDLFSSPERYVTLNVNGDGEMLPRTRLASVPYAITSGSSTPGPPGPQGPPGTVAGNDGQIIYNDGGNGGGAEVYYDNATHFVGIGTDSPVGHLDVTDVTPGGLAAAWVNSDDSGGGLTAYSSNFPFPFNHFADRLSLLTNSQTATGLDIRADGFSSDIRFYTGGLLPVHERIRITAAGSVGIGTTYPQFRFSVEDGAVNIRSLRGDGMGTWQNGLLFTNNSNGLGPWTQAGIWADGSPGFNGSLVFGVDGDFTNNITGLQEAMRITPEGDLSAANDVFVTGSIGIGTFESDHRLQLLSTGPGDGVSVKSSDGDMLIKAQEAANGSGSIDIGTTGGVVGTRLSGHGDSYFDAGYVGIGTANPQADLDVNGDLRITGAVVGTIGPNNGAPISRPAFDSGWTAIDTDEILIFSHLIGGDVNNYVVDMQLYTAISYNRHNYGVGSTFSSFYEEEVGAFWFDLTATHIKVYRYEDDNYVEQVRIRIWYYN